MICKVHIPNRLLIIVLVSLCIRLVFAYYTPAVGDMANSKIVASVVLAGDNAYAQTTMAPNPPPWLYIQASALYLSRLSGLPHSFMVKLPTILADLLIGLIIFHLVQKTNRSKAFLATSFWLFNPLSILISSFQGQFDSMPLLFILVAVVLFTRHYHLSAIALGLGIALKEFPILVLPMFLYHLPKTGKRLVYGALSLVPVAILFIPFVVDNPRALLTNIGQYSGAPDHGWGAVVRGVYWLWQRTAFITVPTLPTIITISKVIFLVFLVRLYLVINKSVSYYAVIASIFLAFIVLFGGVSTQYLLWPLPFLLVISHNQAFVYTLFATLSAVCYYSFFLPEVLLAYLPHNLSTLAGQFSTDPQTLHVPATGLALTGIPFAVFLLYLVVSSVSWLYFLVLLFTLNKHVKA